MRRCRPAPAPAASDGPGPARPGRVQVERRGRSHFAYETDFGRTTGRLTSRIDIGPPPWPRPAGSQEPEAGTRMALRRLVEAGLVEERGRKKGRTWHRSAAAYRALGDKAACVRQRGVEPLQLEQMVLQFVEKHGRITRKDAAALCRITGPQAYRLLKSLPDRGPFEREGSRRRGVG